MQIFNSLRRTGSALCCIGGFSVDLYKEQEDVFKEKREEMVRRQIKSRGVKDPMVLDAMKIVPRHFFVPDQLLERAYDDTPLPIGEGQTISQPYIVSWMTELLKIKKDDAVLEIGTGSGYQAAVLCHIAKFVYSVECIPTLAAEAGERLAALGISNFQIVVGDGSKGYPEHAPYKAIIVTAGSPDIPPLLVQQLADGGRMVVPVGTSHIQELVLVERKKNEVRTRELGSCVFVPLVGEYGWKP
ncbi:MAG: protein-L-isoaspartate(D-aspartate) O-methyltransferase [Actinobacteria bacterium]|nr:protein-L-isoaspartate(D-aspartate) O-methyltransferase [Actinomycetota bacterium]